MSQLYRVLEESGFEGLLVIAHFKRTKVVMAYISMADIL